MAAALNFPSSPTVGQLYAANNKSRIFDGVSWVDGAWLPVTYKFSGAGGTLPGMNIAAGDAIFVLTAGGDNCTAVADNSGNTYTQLANQGNSVNNWCRWWYKLNAPANSNLLITCTFSNAQGGNFNCAFTFSGVTAYDNANPGTFGGPGTTASTGSYSTTSNGVMMIFNSCTTIQQDVLTSPASGPVYVPPVPNIAHNNWSIWYWLTPGPQTSQVVSISGLNSSHSINAAAFR
jgi:hypothetical protein